MKYSDKMMNGLYVGDTCCGKVIGAGGKGVYVELENGQTAYAHGISLKSGTQVFCSLLRHATEESFAKVSIDSCRFDLLAA